MSSAMRAVLQVGHKNPTLPENTDGYETRIPDALGHDQGLR